MPHFRELTRDQLDQVRDNMWARQYYLFTGAGISLDSANSTHLMDSATVLRNKLCALASISVTRSLQQAYSLLKPHQIEDHITRPYTCAISGPTIQKLVSYPWQRIFTLNVDDCAERALEALLGPERYKDVEIKHFSDDFSDVSPAIPQSIIHLHGSVQRPSDGYVFSHQEYAKIIARPNAWMLTLTQLIRGEPFIIAGTTLDEFDFNYYVEQRISEAARPEVAPSILIEPYPDNLTRRLCDNHNLYLFEGTTLEFFDYMETLYGEPLSYWKAQADDGLDGLTLSDRDKLAFGATFELVPKHCSAGRIAPFLLGASLTWEGIEARADVAREVTPSLVALVQSTAREQDCRVLLILDQPGSGKSSLLRRLAFQTAKIHKSVFFFIGKEIIDEESCANILDAIRGECFIFIDNWADHASYFVRTLSLTKRRDIVLIGTERLYRRSYIENGLADEEIKFIEAQLDLEFVESKRLIRSLNDQALSAQKTKNDKELIRRAREITGESISIASCRIQNNYFTFDRIVDDILKEMSSDEILTYATVGISRFCYAEGVERSILLSARKSAPLVAMQGEYAKLRIVRSPIGSNYLIPARSTIADRVIAILRSKDSDSLTQVFVDLANALAPRVNRKQVKLRTPAARLAGGLMDFDRVIKRFVNEHAESFYDDIKPNWEWNSRYWEQCALMKLDRFLANRADKLLLGEAIQNARYAYTIEQHPLSLTTLAKMLFTSLSDLGANSDDIFNEAWSLISEAIEKEAKWASIKATAFVVCFGGVLKFISINGALSGKQTERLRDIIAISHARRLRDPGMVRLREEVTRNVL